MRAEQKIGLSFAAVAVSGSMAFTGEDSPSYNPDVVLQKVSEETVGRKERQRHNLALEGWSNYSQLPPTLVSPTREPRRLATLTPIPIQTPRTRVTPIPSPGKVAPPRNALPIEKTVPPSRIPLPTPTFIPDEQLAVPIYTRGPIGSTVKESEKFPELPFSPGEIGAFAAGIIFLSGLGAWVMVKETCGLIKVIWRKW